MTSLDIRIVGVQYNNALTSDDRGLIMTFPYRDIFVGQFRQGNFRAYYGWPSRVSRFVGTKLGRRAGIVVYGPLQEITEYLVLM